MFKKDVDINKEYNYSGISKLASKYTWKTQRPALKFEVPFSTNRGATHLTEDTSEISKIAIHQICHLQYLVENTIY